jgi:hypothetical protein
MSYRAPISGPRLALVVASGVLRATESRLRITYCIENNSIENNGIENNGIVRNGIEGNGIENNGAEDIGNENSGAERARRLQPALASGSV